MSSTRQMFDTIDVLKLEVADDWPQLPNLVLNPDGEYGTWFWTPADPSIATLTVQPRPALRITPTGVASTVTVESELCPLLSADGNSVYAYAQAARAAGAAGCGVSVHISLYDTNKLLLATSSESTTATADGSITSVSASYPPTASPQVGYLSIAVTYHDPPTGIVGRYVDLADIILVTSPLLTDLDAYTPRASRDWIDITGPTLSIDFGRTPLDANTMTATIRDSTLDPSRSGVIRKGKPARLRALLRHDDGTTAWEHLFSGQVLNGKVTYDLLAVDPVKRAKITLTAVDADTILANTGRPNGAATIEDLPLLVLAGTGVPWIVNGATDQSGDVVLAVPVAVNDQANALDQVVLTRDSAIAASDTYAYAWVNRHGQLDVEDSFHIPSGTPVAHFDESSYTGFDLSYDTDDCVNDITVNVLSIDPDSGSTITTAYGPFTDDLSKRENGDHAETYTIQGVFTADDVASYAGVVLRSNAWPELRINSITMAAGDLDDFTSDGKVFRDLYDLVGIVNTDASIDDLSRIVGITHSIAAGADGQSTWLITLAFAMDGRVSNTTATPALSA